MKFKVDTPKK